MYKILLRSHSKLVNATKMDHGDETFQSQYVIILLPKTYGNETSFVT